MVKFNKKEYIQSIKSLHPADQADSIENLNLKEQTSVLKTSIKNLLNLANQSCGFFNVNL